MNTSIFCRGRTLILGWAAGCWLAGAILHAEIVLPTESQWRYFKGRQEASNPVDAWRAVDFDDTSWPGGRAPFHYGEGGVQGGTRLDDMRYNYTTLFLRRTFTLADVDQIGSLTLRAAVDDGFIAWVNGREIARYRVRAGEPAYDDTANSNAPEPVKFASYTVWNEPGWLREGVNVIAVQVFNVKKTSSDLQFHAELSVAKVDHDPPAVLAVSPPPGVVGELSHITVTFSEAVDGVDAEDLRINGQPARTLTVSGTAYTFGFPQPPFGRVTVAWAPEHGIADLGAPPNPFVPAEPFAGWSYDLTDSLPPQLVWIHPTPDRAVRGLTEVELLFSEPVTGVEATSLRLNDRPATKVSGILAGPYRFEFAGAAPGVASFTWAPDHGIQDTGNPPNPFIGGAWETPVDPDLPVPDVIISEFLAANVKRLTDEEGEPQDWIEIENRGSTPVDLTGWSLTDDASRPGKWVFPATTLPEGGRLVGFASGKDRRVSGAPLHTNFKLGVTGEYLALSNHEQPRRRISEFAPAYPVQRNDHSYGLSPAGEWRYFDTPTPGVANGDSTITGVTPGVRFGVDRGFADAPFDLPLTCELLDAVIRYTLDGSEPTETTGLRYGAPLRIDRIRVVRAAAFAPNRLPSRVKTKTYLLVEDIVHQPATPDGFPRQWGSSKVTTGDYAMDPRIVENPRYSERVRAGLRSLPVLSLVMSMDDWFSPQRGIYSNGNREGIAWERAGSMEFFTPDGRESFQEDCGLRIQGGSSTQPWKSYKLSMRTTFRTDYGNAWLNRRLFHDTPVDRFDTLIVDAGLNYVWTYGGGSNPTDQRGRAKYLTDEYASDLQEASGDVAAHGRYVNVFINGAYWGLHNLHEEPEAAFGATYWGGRKDDYDVMKHTGSNVLDGNGAAWNAMMEAVRRDLKVPANYAAVERWLDLPAFIDYMLVHFYIGDTDWPHHNWYAVRKRVPGAKWYFVSYDSEHSLKDLNHDRTGVNNANTCAEIYDRLRANPDFRLLFADRVQKHFFNGGVYYVDPNHPAWDPAHPERNRPAALYNRRVAEIDLALVAESARWGDNQRPAQPYTRDVEYEETLRWLNETYFPQRSTIVLGQLRNRGLFPDVAAPTFSRHGGVVPAGYPLSMSAPAGTVWFTTDGTDPRVPGQGTVSLSARAYTGAAWTLGRSALVKARARVGTEWSALVEATFEVAGDNPGLILSELMYNAPGGGEYEFLELLNLGPAPVDLTEHRLRGVDYVFPPGTVAQPGVPLLLASDRDPAAWAARYPGVTPDGWYDGTLSDGGEALALEDREGRAVWQVRYEDRGAWPPLADGAGRSLERFAPAADPGTPAAWRESANDGGTPGSWNEPSGPTGVQLSEVLAFGAAPDRADFIELFNPGPGSVSLAGWTLRDEGNAGAFTFPTDATIGPGDFVLVWGAGRTDADGWRAPFGLDREADSVVLRDPTGRTVDALSFSSQVAGLSLGRLGTTWGFCVPTAGTANTAAALGDPAALRLNEWVANPQPGEDDWLEVFNPTNRPVALTGLRFGTGAREAVCRELAAMAPGGFAWFRADERSGPGHLLLKLPAGGATLRLVAPTGEPIDQATYGLTDEDTAWGRLPDGTGIVRALGALTPGRPNSDDPADSDRDADGLPDAWEAAHDLDAGSAKGDNGARGDPDGDGLSNLEEFQRGLDPRVADVAPDLAIERDPAGVLWLSFVADGQRAFRIESRNSLRTGGWEVWRDYPAGAVTGQVRVALPEAAVERTRFYRLSIP